MVKILMQYILFNGNVCKNTKNIKAGVTYVIYINCKYLMQVKTIIENQW